MNLQTTFSVSLLCNGSPNQGEKVLVKEFQQATMMLSAPLHKGANLIHVSTDSAIRVRDINIALMTTPAVNHMKESRKWNYCSSNSSQCISGFPSLRINLSPFTKHFREGGYLNESID